MRTPHTPRATIRSVAAGVGVACLIGAAMATSVGAAPAAQASGADRPEIMMKIHGAAGSHGKPTRSVNLTYHGGVGGSGVVTGADKVYLIYWGSQWNTNDPEVTIQQGFFGHVGGSSWNRSVTQYCQNVPTGTGDCTTALSPVYATNPTGVLGGTWFDNSSAAPSQPTQAQLAAEAVRAAATFGNTTAAKNQVVQYVINTSSGNNSSGFGTQYCAWHSSTGSFSYGTIAYTNMPYITDAGASCGAGFNGLGPNAGITIVGGHEFAETETDIFPNGGWLDKNGAENGDKCAWIGSGGQGASANVNLNGATYPVQSLWSNAFSGGAGGCVNSY